MIFSLLLSQWGEVLLLATPDLLVGRCERILLLWHEAEAER